MTFLYLRFYHLSSSPIICKADVTPSFLAISTSSHTPPGASKPLTYTLCPFHRVIPEFIVQTGDVTSGDGRGGTSIYPGGFFSDENLGWRSIDAAGLVCMANRGKGTDTNSSQFFVTLGACPTLEGRNTVFGHVVQGMEVVRMIERVDTDEEDRPLEGQQVLIARCGQLEKKNKPQVQSSRAKETDTDSGRGRKRRRVSHSPSDSVSDSSGSSAMSVTPSPQMIERREKNTHRRRSDAVPDHTFRGRTLTRSPSTDPEPDHRHKREGGRKRGRSPSRSRTESQEEKAQIPDLRRLKRRSRSAASDRTKYRREDKNADSKGRQRGRYESYRREDEDAIMHEEREREGGAGRFDGAVGYGNGYGYGDGGRLGGGGGGGSGGSNGRLGDGRTGRDGFGADDGGVKFKGRGSMKYRERERERR